MGLLIVKNHQPMQFVESLLMKCLCLHLCPKLLFFSRKQFSQKMFFELIKKAKQMYVLPILVERNFAKTTFDLWMSKEAHDTFFLVINFLRTDW